MADDTLQRLQAFAESIGKDGDLGLIWRGDEWLASAEFGREAPDSPMVGGAAYGNEPTAVATIEQMLADTHFKAPTEVAPSHEPQPVPANLDGAERIALERARQRQYWTDTHDDSHDAGELAAAAVSYTLYADLPAADTPPGMWPWDKADWRPTGDPITQLTKAGALLAAEIDRLLRAGAANAT